MDNDADIHFDSPGATWDSGLEWDITTGPHTGDISPYLNLVTSKHRQKPKFIRMLTMFLQPLADNIATMKSMPSLFDLDVAVGDQLDKTGEWIGPTRILDVPLEGVYFSLDVDGLGLDEGVWQGPNDPDDGLIVLPDDSYRLLLKARVASNQWDGSIPGAYATWAILFANEGITILIFDNQDMTMDIGVAATGTIDAVTLGLLTGGYLNLRPAGVGINGYFVPSVPGPFFGLDAENDAIAGLDVGAWAVSLSPT